MQKIIFLLTFTFIAPIFGADELQRLLKPKAVLDLYQICLPVDIKYQVNLDSIAYHGYVDWTRGEHSVMVKNRICDRITKSGRFVNQSDYLISVFFNNGSRIAIDSYAKEKQVIKKFYDITFVSLRPRPTLN